MAQAACRWIHGSSLLHKDRASCLDARHSFASPAKKTNSFTRLSTRTQPHKLKRFGAASSYAAASPTAPPTARWPRNSTVIRARSASGDPASPRTDSTAWLISLAAVLRGFFPPEDRHKVVILATSKPADLGLPISHWSLEDLAIQIVKDAHYRDMSSSTINRILNANRQYRLHDSYVVNRLRCRADLQQHAVEQGGQCAYVR